MISSCIRSKIHNAHLAVTALVIFTAAFGLFALELVSDVDVSIAMAGRDTDEDPAKWLGSPESKLATCHTGTQKVLNN